ncbi:MAG: HAD family hydrolase [candidate division FCPU426 bacterium]
MKHLYVSDLDGTLFSDFAGFDDEGKVHLRRLMEAQGLRFTFATARVVPSGLQALGHPPISLPMIGCGGAVLQLPDGTVLHEILMAPGIVAEAVALFQAMKLGMTVILSPRGQHQRRWWTPRDFKLMDSFIASHWSDESFLPLDNASDLEGLPCVGLSCCGAEGSLEGIRAWAKQYPELRLEIMEDPYQKGVEVGFLQDDRANKGEAIEKLCLHLGVPLEGVTVFGDALNDLSMFRLACRKIAVDRAVPEIKALADLVLGPEDSVLKFMERELRI